MITTRPWLLVLAVLFGGAVARAQDVPAASELSEDELGFADSNVATPSAAAEGAQPEPATPSALRVTGYVAVQSAFRLARSGPDVLGKLRQVLAPRIEYQRGVLDGAFDLRLVLSGRAEADYAFLLRPNAYDGPTMELYGSQLIVGESYLALFARRLELAFGEQIVNLGQGEVLTLLDVVNPRDLREPLFTDLDQIRLPVLMSRASITGDRFRADVMAVHEPYFGLLPPPTGEFSPLRKLLLEDPLLGPALEPHELGYRHLPERNPFQAGATQFHAQLGYHGSRVDLTLQASSLFEAFGVPALPSAQAFAATRIDLPNYHPRYTLVGHSGVLTLGAFLLRWELAGELGHPQIVRSTGSLPALNTERFDIVRGLTGLTYVPNARTNVALEASQALVIDAPQRAGQPRAEPLFPVEATQLALRASQLFWRERAQLTCVLLWIGLTDFNAAAARAELSVELIDALRAAVGAVGYLPSSDFGPFYGFERNHRAYLNLRWDFAIH